MVREIIIDVVGVVGLSMLGYGLYQFMPWVAWSVVGALMVTYSVRASK